MTTCCENERVKIARGQALFQTIFDSLPDARETSRNFGPRSTRLAIFGEEELESGRGDVARIADVDAGELSGIEELSDPRSTDSNRSGGH